MPVAFSNPGIRVCCQSRLTPDVVQMVTDYAVLLEASEVMVDALALLDDAIRSSSRVADVAGNERLKSGSMTIRPNPPSDSGGCQSRRQ